MSPFMLSWEAHPLMGLLDTPHPEEAVVRLIDDIDVIMDVCPFDQPGPEAGR
jgi:hypothetical protein